MGVKFGTEEGTFGPLLRAKFHPHRCNVSPLRGENPQNRPLSKLNNRHFALRAMLPVNYDRQYGSQPFTCNPFSFDVPTMHPSHINPHIIVT